MTKFNQSEYVAAYHREKEKQVKINLHRTHDADIIEKLESVGNKQGYIKKLIRKDIKNENNI